MPAVSMFHKPIKKEISDVIQKPRPPRPRPRPPPPAQTAETDERPGPSGAYQDYKIISVAKTAWKYDVMKFDARGKEIDPTKWNQPVKLNRKSGRLPDNEVEPVPIELKPMLGPDGKPVIGVDGKIVMVGPDGKVPQQTGGINGKANGNSKDALKGKGKGRQPFKKKTRQVHPVPEEVLQLRREEKYPWVMEESGDNGQVWTGRLEDSERAKTYALLVPIGQDFQFVPAHRWYKFQKRPSYKILALEEAEAEYAKVQKNKDPERWLMRKKAANGSGPSEATLATFKREKSERKMEVDDEATTLQTVDKGEDDLFGDDDDDEGKLDRKRKEKQGFEGDVDEVEYEDEMSDDEEKQEIDGEDEETKELDERLKREYRQANKMRDGHIDEDEDEDDIDALTGAGKDLKKLVKRTEKNEAYDSDDDEKNPYISEDEEPEDTTPQPVSEGPAVMNQAPSQPPSGAATPINRPLTPHLGKPATAKPIQPPLPGPSQPRAASPGLGNVVVAQRATSPKVPTKSKQRPVPRPGSRPGSPLASRASSPVPAIAVTVNPPSSITPGSVSTTGPTAAPPAVTQNLKRKATDDAPTPGVSTPGVSTPGAAGQDGKPRKKPKRQLEESMVIEFLKENMETTTKECIQKFQLYLKTNEAKKAFTNMVKKVAVVKKNGALKLRPEYQNSEAT